MNDTKSDVAFALAPRLNHWEIVGWPAHQQRDIWRSWAQGFARTRHNAAAIAYYNKSLESSPYPYFHALCMRGAFYRNVANVEKALEDGRQAASMRPRSQQANLLVANALYELNKFEETKLQLHTNLRLRAGKKATAFLDRLDIVDHNFRDSLGASLRPFFLKNSNKMNAIYEKTMKVEKPPKPSTRWLQLRDQKECDVNSVSEKDNVWISTLEMARRKRKMKIYNQNYLNGSWIDVAFLKTLCRSHIVLLDRYYKTAPERQEYLNSSYGSVKKFIRMLHARSPIYNEEYHRVASLDMQERMHQANRFRIQYQTRRNMHSILNTIRAIREQKDVPRLRRFVSKVMGEFAVLKTMRIMPWKIEFMNEVYNHLALSLCETYSLPNYKVSPYDNDSMCRLLGVNPFKPSEAQGVVFGDRSTYVYEDTNNLFDQGKEYRRTKVELDRRLHFSTLPIERSYLLYEIADCLLTNNLLVHSLLFAKRAILEARRASSKIWEFLATMLQAKAHAILCKYERQADVLNNAYALAKDLKSPSLCTFIELCRMLNKDYMTLRKMSVLVATKRPRYRSWHRSNSNQQTSPDADSG